MIKSWRHLLAILLYAILMLLYIMRMFLMLCP